MERELQQYYETLFDLFTKDGWDYVQLDIQEAIEAIQIENLKDAKELHYAQGQLLILNRFAKYAETVEHGYKEALESVDEDL